HVRHTQSFTLKEIINKLPRVELTAVNQCSGNSRSYFEPRVAGGPWSNGAMGNARWTGVRLRDVLDHAGVKPGAIQVRFSGLDGPVVPDGPKFIKSLDMDHVRDGEVMIAYAMNGEQLPLLNGFPLRLVVPGWYATVGREMRMLVENADDQTAADPNLLRIMARAHHIQARLIQNPKLSVHDIAREERVSAAYLYTLLRLPWLAPD